MRPSNRLVNRTVDYWLALSFELANRGDYNTSILLPIGAFYFVRELELFYGNCSDLDFIDLSKSKCYKKASMILLYWASHPRFESKELSKKIALDIFELVKHDCKLTRYMDYNKFITDRAFSRLTFSNSPFEKDVYDLSLYKKFFDIFINKLLYFESKPYYEIKDEYEKYNRKIDFYSFYQIEKNFNYYLFNREKTIIRYVFSRCSKFRDMHKGRVKLENTFGYMEFAAIALLINSYYCHNNRLPNTIEELEKWCGRKLPTIRKNNTNYVIDTKGEHTLKFDSIRENYYDQKELYFDFSN